MNEYIYTQMKQLIVILQKYGDWYIQYIYKYAIYLYQQANSPKKTTPTLHI